MPVNGQRGALDARFFPGEYVQHFHRKALALCIAGKHPHEHAGPVLGLSAAGPGVQGQNGIVAVVLVAEQQPQFQVRQSLLALFQLALNFFLETVVVFFHSHFPQGFNILNLRFQGMEGIHITFQIVGFLGHLLGLIRIVPEPRSRHLVLQVLNPFFLLGDFQGPVHFLQFVFQTIDFRF